MSAGRSAHVKSPVGTAACDDEPSLRTLPDIARGLRAMAGELAADDFMLCLRAADDHSAPFVCAMDPAYPGSSAEAERFVARLPVWLAAMAAASPVPLWWEGPDGCGPQGIEAVRWAERIDLAAPAGGLALPLSTERGRAGLLVFRGNAMKARADRLPAMQAQCFALFSVVANTAALDERPAPSISKRELECLKLTASGHTSEEIGRLLGLSIHTTNQYLTSTTQKLNAVNRVHAVAKALREGLIA